MSTAGQAIGGIGGAVAGFFLAGPLGIAAGTSALYGAQIGMTIGGYLDPPKGPKQEPPATKDLTVQTATYGASRPRLYGTITVYANIFWLENNLLSVVVKKTKQGGGKGGTKKTTVTTKSYYGTFAAGLCDCPSAPIVGVKRIWLGGKLWYDAGSSDQDTIRASNDAATNFTLHLGSDTQLADDRMQATLTVADCPAYRGLAYIVFKDLPLAPYGDTLMGLQIKVEVVAGGAISTETLNYTEISTVMAGTAGAWFRDEFYVFDGTTPLNYSTSHTGDTGSWADYTMPAAANGATVDISVAQTSKYLFAHIAKEGGIWRSSNGRAWTQPSIDARTTTWALSAYGNNILLFPRLSTVFSDGKYSTDGGDTWLPTSAITPYGSVPKSGVGVSDTHAIVTAYSWATPATERVIQAMDFSTGVFTKIAVPDGLGLTSDTSFNAVTWFPDINQWVFVEQTNKVALLSADLTTWTAASSLPLGWCPLVYAFNRMWTRTNSYQHFTYDMVTWTALPSSIGIVTYGLVFNGAIGLYFGQSTGHGIGMQLKPGSIASTNVTLASIVSAECLQSKTISAGDIDVTLLASQLVRGYKVSNVAAIRAALEPLQGAWPFDVVHRGFKLWFKPRGTTSVVTIPEANLDARNSGDAPGTALTSTREMDSVLPRRVTMQYLDYSREYDVNTQYAERLNTDAVDIQSLDLAIVLTSDEAARIVEVLLYMYWLERYSLKFSLPSTYNNLEPGDVVTITASTGTYVLRLTQITYTANGLIECDAKYSRSATYTSTAVGGTPPAVTVTLALPGDSAIELLDIPLLDDSMNQAGYIAAMTGYSSGWTAGEIYRTDDGGASWTDLQAFASPGSSIGYAVNAIGAGRTDIFDSASVLQIYFLHDAAFSSVTELAVLNGSNYFAYGAHGRWEIIAAKTCTLQSDGSYKFSDLLRGRKGTEWACGLHATGDTVVALDNSSVIFVGASTSSIGLPRVYRGATDRQELSAVSDYNFTYTGVNLECYSPVYLNGSRNPTTNVWSLSWTPRTRVGGEWRDYVDATMVEGTELYAVEIYSDDTYTTIKRTILATSPTAQYTSADQFADFAGMQASLYVKVCQVSAYVGNGYYISRSFVGGVLSNHFTQINDITYFELLPSNLQTLNEVFGADTGFTKYTEGSAGTTAVASNKYTITHVGLKNDLVAKNTISFAMPQVWVEVSVSVTNTGGTGYDNGGVGIIKDANNFLLASMDRVANVIRIQIKIAGTNTFIGSISLTFGTSFKLGMSLVGNSVCVWADTGSGYVYKVGANVTSYYDFRTTGNLTGWNPGFILANGGGNSTWDFSELKAGSFGGVGMRDQTLVTNDDATPYLATATAIQFTATAVDPRGTGYCGVYTLDMVTKALVQTAALMVSRSGKTYNDLACHIIRYAGGNRRVLISTWGNGFGASLQVLYGLLTSGDVLTGANVVTLAEITLPGQSGVSPGAYDPMLAWDSTNSRWLIAYTLVDNTSFSGNPFYPALAYSSDMYTFTLVAKDTAYTGYEGTKIVSDDGVLFVTAGGPAGTGNQARLYNQSLNYLSVMDITLSGGSDTQPHAALFSYGGYKYVLSFDNTRYGGVAFTWGHVRLYASA